MLLLILRQLLSLGRREGSFARLITEGWVTQKQHLYMSAVEAYAYRTKHGWLDEHIFTGVCICKYVGTYMNR